MSIKLMRNVNGRFRYYILSVTKNLFNAWLLEKIYGSSSNKKPTRILYTEFQDEASAVNQMKLKVEEKLRKGYIRMF